MKGFLIAGTASGVGKTTITLAIEAALRQRGMTVQPYKCGPDYLDTAHHSMICGRKCRNLDTVMLSAEENLASLRRSAEGADIAVVEGMMGLFDGISGASELGSSAQIAKMLRLPVVLVMDASSCSRSIAATLLGFAKFDKELSISAVILNRVAGEGHYKMLAEAIQGSVEVPILGWIPRESALSIPERHLGLHDANERAWSQAEIALLADVAEKHLDLNRLVAIATSNFEDALPAMETLTPLSAAPRVRIAVARDAAFSFYYEDNFDLLRDCGAELIEFSPMHDERLPDGTDALYIGGGYPELHAETLSENRSMITAMQQFCAAGKPVYAECGGMMYLGQEIIVEGKTFSMAGVLPLRIEMSPRLVKFGYVNIHFEHDCVLGRAGTEAMGHSFHYSRIESIGMVDHAYLLKYIRAGRSEHEGFATQNVLASYVHIHFRTNRQLAQNFVDATLAAKKKSFEPMLSFPSKQGA